MIEDQLAREHITMANLLTGESFGSAPHPATARRSS